MRRLRIGMIDADLLDNGTRHPNLAQMKISAYCKSRHHNVELLLDASIDFKKYDLIIISKVFNYTTLPEEIEKEINKRGKISLLNTSIVQEIEELEKSRRKITKISIGGTGFFEDGGRNLDGIIEHIKPDYSLYNTFVDTAIKSGRKKIDFDDYLNYSIGFTSRGCFRKCDFCVNKKYDRAQKHSNVIEFLEESRPRIYLWDDNIFALKDGWEEIFEELKATGKPFQFRQGLDIRLLTDKKAKMLSECKYHGDFIFAFDYLKDRVIIEEKLRLWRKYNNKTTKLYVLCAFSPVDRIKKWEFSNAYKIHPIRKRGDVLRSLELRDVVETFERIKILMKYGCLPYIMRYESYKRSYFKDLYIQLARWCNQPRFFKKMSFREFCIANKDYAKNSNRCRSYSTMVDFENEFPNVAKNYFDLKYESLNEYSTIARYARHTLSCPVCTEDGTTWDNIVKKTIGDKKTLEKYYSRNLDLICFSKTKKECNTSINLASKRLAEIIANASYEEIIEIIDKIPSKELESNLIPQPGNLENAIAILSMLNNNDNEMTYDEIGAELSKLNKSQTADKKYGESYAKLAALLDLVIFSDKKPIKIKISQIGKKILSLGDAEQRDYLVKQILRIPIVQNILRSSKDKKIKIKEHLPETLSESTILRRISVIKFILKEVKEVNEEIDRRLRNIEDM